MKTKYILIFSILSLSLCAFYVMPDSKEVILNIEMRVTYARQFGKIISIGILLENNTNNNIYLDGCRVPRVRILKKQSKNNSFKDYTEEWGLHESNKDQLSKINAAIGIDTIFYRVLDEKTNKFIDRNAQTYFESALKERRSVFRSKSDSTVIGKWFYMQFENMAYIKKHDRYVFVYCLNTLPEGVYKIFFNYDNKNQESFQFENQSSYDYLKLRLPESLSGYKRWRGELKSDTLYLNIR
jgi:hypothetical protein